MGISVSTTFFGHMFAGIFPKKYALYMVGTSNKSVPEMAIDHSYTPL